MSEEEDDRDEEEEQAKDQHGDQRAGAQHAPPQLSSRCFCYGFVLIGGNMQDL